MNQGNERKTIFAQIALAMLLACSAAHAATPEQTCWSSKSPAVGRYITCKLESESLLKASSTSQKYQKAIKKCATSFSRKFDRAVSNATAAGGSCVDAKLSSLDYRAFIDADTESIANQLGKGVALKSKARMCRNTKNELAGQYQECKLQAELTQVNWSLNENPNREDSTYAEDLVRCERVFKRGWREIESQTRKAGASCFNPSQTSEDILTLLDGLPYIYLVGTLFSGDILPHIDISVSGAPLQLTAGGTAGTLTVTNTSTTATATDITATLVPTRLLGKLTVSSDTCGSVAPGATCQLSFKPGSELVEATEVRIEGANTRPFTVSISILVPPA